MEQNIIQTCCICYEEIGISFKLNCDHVMDLECLQ